MRVKQAVVDQKVEKSFSVDSNLKQDHQNRLVLPQSGRNNKLGRDQRHNSGDKQLVDAFVVELCLNLRLLFLGLSSLSRKSWQSTRVLGE